MAARQAVRSVSATERRLTPHLWSAGQWLLYHRYMATKTTWESKGEEWVFEEGKPAKVTPRGETRPKSGDFRVLKVISGTEVLTDLKGYSSHGWQGPLVTWAGTYKFEPEEADKVESENDGDEVSSGEGE